MDTVFTKALCEVIKEEIAKGNEVQFEGAGIFYFEHQNQHQQQYRDGRVLMMPPKDQIQFIPDQKSTD